MRRLVLVGLLLCGSVKAQDFGHETRVVAYWEKPFGGSSAMGNVASFGFKLTTGTVAGSGPSSKAPTVDVRFDGQGFRYFGLIGVMLRQNQVAGGGPPAEINWWIVGGMAIGARVITHQEIRKSKKEETRSPPIRCVTVLAPDGRPETFCR